MAMCKQILDSWKDHNEGGLSEEKSRRIQRHLDACPACRKQYAQRTQLNTLVNEVDMDPISKRRLEVAVAARRSPDMKDRFPKAVLIRWGTAFAALALLVVTFLMTMIDREEHPDIQQRQAAVSHSRAPSEMDSIQAFSTGTRPRRIELTHGTFVWLDIQSSIKFITDTSQLTHFRLQRGRVIAKVGAHEPGFRFVVETPSATVIALGTVFSVEIDSNRNETTRVTEGVVEVHARESTSQYLVYGGEELILGGIGPRRASVHDVKRDSCLVSGKECADPDEHNDSPGDKVAEPSPPKKKVSKQSPADIKSQVLEAIKKQRFEQAEQLIHTMKPRDISPSVRIDFMTRLARAYRHAGQLERAARTYERLSAEFPKSDAAINGLVTLAQIELNSLGDAGVALTHFERYLKRRPKGLLSEVARAGKVRALYRLGRFAEVSEASKAYLKAHPNGISASEISQKQQKAEKHLEKER